MEIDEVSGGKALWILIADAICDACEGMADGYAAGKKKK